jgi:hypothetical protein
MINKQFQLGNRKLLEVLSSKPILAVTNNDVQVLSTFRLDCCLHKVLGEKG